MPKSSNNALKSKGAGRSFAVATSLARGFTAWPLTRVTDPAQGKAAPTLFLCSSPLNWPALCDLRTRSRALTTRLSTLPHRFAFVFSALCRAGCA
jgi:hypothetical protein